MQPRSTITPEAHRGRHFVDFLNLVQLAPLMNSRSGTSEIVIGLMDGPVAVNHQDLIAESVKGIGSEPGAGCAHPGSAACTHGTFTAGILSAREVPQPRQSAQGAPLVRPIFRAAPPTGRCPAQLPRNSPRRSSSA